MPTHYMQHNVYKICTCDYLNMCGTADSLMLTQYVRYSRQFNADTICARNDQNTNTIIIFINSNWVITRWQWLFYMNTKSN